MGCLNHTSLRAAEFGKREKWAATVVVPARTISCHVMALSDRRLHQGFLLKRGANNTHSWKKRFFVLYETGKMYYFKV